MNTIKTARRIAAATLTLTAAGLTFGALPSMAIDPGLIPSITIPSITIPSITLPTVVTPITINPGVFDPATIITIDPTLFVGPLTASINAPAGPVERGASFSYTMVLQMPASYSGASLPVQFLHSAPVALQNVVWSCVGGSGASCGATSTGTGSIATSVTIPAGGRITFQVNGSVAAAATNFTIAMSATRGSFSSERTKAIVVNVPAPTTTAAPAPAPTTTAAPAPAPTTTAAPAPTTVPAPTPTTSAPALTTPATAAPTTAAPTTAQPVVVNVTIVSPETKAAAVTKNGAKKIVKKAKKAVRKVRLTKKSK